MYKLLYLNGNFPTQQTYWVMNVIYGGATIFAGLAVFFLPAVNLRILSRPILPLLGAGFLLFPALHARTPIVPFALFQLGFALDMYTWLLFVRLASYHRQPASVISWGMFLITGSIALSELIFTTILAGVTSAGLNASGFASFERALKVLEP
ncbi:MAG: hypothetical protein M1335_02040 [Chloroflexi bacterium]|nr:hypothetical protein [Chloroflexota bacterium]